MQKKVLIILPSDKFLHRQILEGILEYGRKRGPWQFHFETGDHYEQGIGKGHRWGCTGIIALVREREQVNSLIRMEIPSVFLNPPPAQKGEQKPHKRQILGALYRRQGNACNFGNFAKNLPY